MAFGVPAKKDHHWLDGGTCSDANVSKGFLALKYKSTSSWCIKFYLPLFFWWELPFIVGWCGRSELSHLISLCSSYL